MEGQLHNLTSARTYFLADLDKDLEPAETRRDHQDPTQIMSSDAHSRPAAAASSSASRLAVPSGSEYHGTPPSSPPAASNMTPQQYIARMFDPQQMDVQSALDQMKALCTLTPQRVYKMSYYRKQTKNHWSRDDPAFAFLQIVFLALASLAYCVAFREEGMITSTIGFAVKSVVINWLLTGVVMASVGRMIANQHLMADGSTRNVRQRVEWLYAFDIHCNAFFPLFVLLYAVQYFLLPLVLGKSLFALIVSNTLYAVAFSWYFYVTHLGYRALPFLSNTEVFLFPIAGVLFVYVLNFVGYPFGFGWNASRIVAYIYFD